MKLHAITFSLFIIGAYSASIPDKKDIEKKLTEVVKEVLNKDDKPVENISSEQELIEPVNEVKDVGNNLRKSAPCPDIPVKVVIEDVQPVLKSDDKKEDNEVSPQSEESSEIVREEIDLKNPGLPQHTQHDTQNPEHFEDAQQAIVLRNSEWRASTQYAAVQKEINDLKDSFEKKMNELFETLQEHMKTHSDAEKKEEEKIRVRSSVRQDSTSPSSIANNSTNQWAGPFGSMFQNWATSFQQSLQNLNTTVNNYWNNSTNSNSSSNCSGGGSNNIFSWGSNNPLNFGQQQGQGQQQQADEPARPGLWQTVQQNVQNFFQGNQANPGNQPAGAQSDSPQPVQPNRPVIQAFQNAIGLFQRPEPQPQKPSQTTSQEGANVVPVDAKPNGENQKEKPEQAPPQPQQSGPIKQMIDNSPVVQSLAGAVQRIQHAITPTKPREEPIKDTEDKKDQGIKAGFIPVIKPPHRPGSGDNTDISSGGIDTKIVPGVIPEKEMIEKETPEKPTNEEKAPEVKDKTE